MNNAAAACARLPPKGWLFREFCIPNAPGCKTGVQYLVDTYCSDANYYQQIAHLDTGLGGQPHSQPQLGGGLGSNGGSIFDLKVPSDLFSGHDAVGSAGAVVNTGSAGAVTNTGDNQSAMCVKAAAADQNSWLYQTYCAANAPGCAARQGTTDYLYDLYCDAPSSSSTTFGLSGGKAAVANTAFSSTSSPSKTVSSGRPWGFWVGIGAGAGAGAVLLIATMAFGTYKLVTKVKKGKGKQKHTIIYDQDASAEEKLAGGHVHGHGHGHGHGHEGSSKYDDPFSSKDDKYEDDKSFFGGKDKNRSAASDFVDRDRDRWGDDERQLDGGASRLAHVPTRPVDKDKAEQELNLNIKKATSPEESAPKQKHVRKCIVYTWDYHSSASIWSALRVQPILSDEVQTFKALITVHKILQEGHPITLKEGQNQTGWLETCARTVGSDVSRGYGALIRAYVTLILAKLKFHRQHPDFNGLFEYEEYVSLRGVDDPNEGYETISDLMNLQDSIDTFQKLIFAHFRGSANNECRISALVPQVKESYGIYRFITSMLRAMHRRTDAMEALEPLRDRYDAQHYGLRKFYYECSNLKYLTGLINVPKLPQEPPNLLDSGDAPDLPRRPVVKSPTPPPAAPSPRSDLEEQKRALREYEEKQAALEAQRLAEKRRLADLQAQQQREFEEQQRQQQERERQQQEDLQRQQAMMAGQANAGRLAELEREILSMRGQWERDQMMLERYDGRVKALEGELVNVSGNIQQQLQSKDQMMGQLQDQVTLWRNKYEALAKLYSQLRTEHLEMLAKYKSMQLKANSAQEAIDKMERMERDVKAKNLELADMIRERDRARFDVDRMKSSQKEELERLKRDLRFAEERADDASRSKGSEVSGLLSKYNRQLDELENSLRSKQIQIDDLLHKLDEKDGEAARIRDELATENAIQQETLDATFLEMQALKAGQGENDEAVNAQIDNLVLDQEKKFNAIIDSILQAASAKVDEALYELESPLHDGNQNSTAAYTLSMIEKATTSATEFATVFNLFLSRDQGGEHVEVIKSANNFAQSIAEVLTNTKGLSRMAPDDDVIDKLTQSGKVPGDVAVKFFTSLQSYRLQGVSPSQRKEVVIRCNMEAKSALQKLSTTVEALVPKQKGPLATANGDIGSVVESEMQAAARAIEAATARLQALMSRPKDGSLNTQVHDAILEASLAITNAIGRLIRAATASQEEIVTQGRGSSTSQAFYKRNNRWTEGLISAAKAVARATTFLIETADGVINDTKSLEQLIVASNEVASATAQLVQASRVKSELMSKTQETLELAAKAVTEACKALVRQVKAISAKQLQAEDPASYDNMAAFEFKTAEMEVQVSIVTLEKELADARRKLGVMRRSAYHAVDDDSL